MQDISPIKKKKKTEYTGLKGDLLHASTTLAARRRLILLLLLPPATEVAQPRDSNFPQ